MTTSPLIIGKERKVLVIDDNPTNIRVVVSYLQDQDFTILTARSGESGLERAKHGQPDIILLDIMMPVMDGFETCKLLKEGEQTKHIPVIFMTALDDVEQKVQGFAVGAVDYITKPAQYREVVARVNTHLRILELTNHLEQLVAERTQELSASLQREQVLAEELKATLVKEEELGQLKSQVIEVVTHEFRTPLTSISQSVSLLQNFSTRLSEEKKEELYSRVSQSIFFINDLLRDVSTISMMDKNGIEVRRTAISFTTLCQNLEQSMQDAYQEGDERLHFIYEPTLDTMMIDVEHIQQIASILISNALKFSPIAEPVTVTLATKPHTLLIHVTDKGVGVPLDEQEKIFDMFGRASNVDARRGLGIGLRIAKRLVMAMDGRLEVLSAGQGQGSTFVVTIPLAN